VGYAGVAGRFDSARAGNGSDREHPSLTPIQKRALVECILTLVAVLIFAGSFLAVGLPDAYLLAGVLILGGLFTFRVVTARRLRNNRPISAQRRFTVAAGFDEAYEAVLAAMLDQRFPRGTLFEDADRGFMSLTNSSNPWFGLGYRLTARIEAERPGSLVIDARAELLNTTAVIDFGQAQAAVDQLASLVSELVAAHEQA
jgi:hypothetical protein